MIKTVCITSSVSRKAGGLFQSVRQLHQELSRLEAVAVDVLGLEDEFTSEDLLQWGSLKIQALPVRGPRSFGYAPGLDSVLNGGEYDLIHLHGIWQYPSWLALSWHRQTGRPYIISPRGMLDPWALKNSRWKKRLAAWGFENRNLQSAACLHALCPPEAESFRRYGLKNPIAIIPNGIDLPIFPNAEMPKTEMLKSERAEGRVESGLPSSALHSSLSALRPPPPWAAAIEPGQKVLLFLSRIHPKKGLPHLVRAWAAVQKPSVARQTAPSSISYLPSPPSGRPSTLRSHGPRSEWVLAIAGPDELGHEAEIKSLATSLGLVWADIREREPEDGGRRAEGRNQMSDVRSLSSVVRRPSSVLFTGPLHGAAKLAAFAGASAFVLPSFSEGFSMAVLEAAGAGLPVLLTPQCNFPELAKAGGAIEVSPDVADCEVGLRQLLAFTDTERQAMGQRGRELVARDYTWSRIADQMLGVYRWLLDGGSPPPCVHLT